MDTRRAPPLRHKNLHSHGELDIFRRDFPRLTRRGYVSTGWVPWGRLRAKGIIATVIPGIFLDRDGVLIANRANYVRKWADVEFLPGIDWAMRTLSDLNAKVVIVTNQSAVGRGIISLTQAVEINHKIQSRIEALGGRVDAVYMCPHAPEENCACRKPEPGMLLDATRDLQLDIRQSVMIGDALTDIKAGKRAGVRHSILVLTGRGATQVKLPEAHHLQPFGLYTSLPGAVARISEWWNESAPPGV